MEQFLSTYDESHRQEMARIEQLESSIVTALQQMSRNLSHSGHLPSVDDFVTMRENLAFKEGELEKSRKTAEGLAKEHRQLQQNLQKVRAKTDSNFLLIRLSAGLYATILSGELYSNPV